MCTSQRLTLYRLFQSILWSFNMHFSWKLTSYMSIWFETWYDIEYSNQFDNFCVFICTKNVDKKVTISEVPNWKYNHFLVENSRPKMKPINESSYLNRIWFESPLIIYLKSQYRILLIKRISTIANFRQAPSRWHGNGRISNPVMGTLRDERISQNQRRASSTLMEFFVIIKSTDTRWISLPNNSTINFEITVFSF